MLCGYATLLGCNIVVRGQSKPCVVTNGAKYWPHPPEMSECALHNNMCKLQCCKYEFTTLSKDAKIDYDSEDESYSAMHIFCFKDVCLHVTIVHV